MVISHFGIFVKATYDFAMQHRAPDSIDARVRTQLREMRISAGLRQSDLALRLGLPQSFVSKYEIGDRALSISEVRQICQVLGSSLSTFVQKLEETIVEVE